MGERIGRRWKWIIRFKNTDFKQKIKKKSVRIRPIRLIRSPIVSLFPKVVKNLIWAIFLIHAHTIFNADLLESNDNNVTKLKYNCKKYLKPF
jgi:hypothetical protein